MIREGKIGSNRTKIKSLWKEIFVVAGADRYQNKFVDKNGKCNMQFVEWNEIEHTKVNGSGWVDSCALLACRYCLWLPVYCKYSSFCRCCCRSMINAVMSSHRMAPIRNKVHNFVWWPKNLATRREMWEIKSFVFFDGCTNQQRKFD